MPFLSEHVTVTKDSNSRKAIILRMYHPHTFSKLTQYPLKKPVKRVSSFISFPDHRKNKRKTEGVMTVEAAAAVPFFLCFFINILSLILFFHAFITNLESLHQQGRQLVMLAASAEDITESLLSDCLDTAGIPEPDLLIRTCNEQRISNFLLWQSAYAEYWFSDILWPDFKAKHLEKAIEDYNKRNRRFGGV